MENIKLKSKLTKSNLKGTVLTRRETHVLDLLSQGNTDIDMGKLLGLSNRTVEKRRKTVILKLGAKNSAHAVRLGFKKKLIK